MARYEREYTGDRRTAHFSVQLTPYERSRLEQLAKAASLSLASSYSSQPVAAAERDHAAAPVERRCPRACRGAGARRNDLNQLARHANTTGAMPARNALAAVLNDIVNATRVLTTL